MNPVKEFGGFEGKSYAESTRRVYRSAVKKALKIVGKAPDECESYEELLALFRENLARKKFPKELRLAPFLSFLESKLPKKPEEIPDYEAIRNWVLDRIEKETKATRKALHFVRRDLAMLTCLCVAPEKGSPRSWAKTTLTVTQKRVGDFEVKLWDKAVETPGLALTLLYWHSWRERLDRPEQSRLHRKAWAYSQLLFPNSQGEALKKQALHDALSRLGVPELGVRLTPELVRKAFLQLNASKPGFRRKSGEGEQ
jgi:hypothetical protein